MPLRCLVSIKLTQYCTNNPISTLNCIVSFVSSRWAASPSICSFLWSPSYRSYCLKMPKVFFSSPGLEQAFCPRSVTVDFPSLYCPVRRRCPFNNRWPQQGVLAMLIVAEVTTAQCLSLQVFTIANHCQSFFTIDASFLQSVWSYGFCECLVGLVVKASPSRAENPGFESSLRRDVFGFESYQWLKNWHSSGHPARRLAL